MIKTQTFTYGDPNLNLLIEDQSKEKPIVMCIDNSHFSNLYWFKFTVITVD